MLDVELKEYVMDREKSALLQIHLIRAAWKDGRTSSNPISDRKRAGPMDEL